MADDPIDVVGGDSGFLDERVHALGNGRHGEAEDGLSVHRHVLRAQRAADADQRVAAHADDVFIRRVRAKLEDGRARAVAEEHTGVSIGHIQNGTHLFRADDKGIALLIGQQQTARSFHCEQKARAGCADIHHRDVLRQTERSVNETGRARHDVFAGGGRHEHAADF